MKRLHVSILALVASLPVPAVAQDIVLDEIIVTANRTPTDRNRTGTSVSVVSATELGASQGVGIADAFSRLAGVSVSQQGAFGSPASVRIRGADQRYIAVFVDGVRVTDPTGVQTQFDFGMLPAFGVDRIEILRGSQSALWGGSAVGGVINITSARPAEEGTRQEVQAEAGSFGTVNLRYGLTQKIGDLETALTLTHLRTDGFSAVAAGTERDGAEASRMQALLRYRVSDSLTVGASMFSQRTFAEYDGLNLSSYMLEDQDKSQTRNETGARLFAELATGNTDHVFEVTSFRIGRDYDEPDGPDADTDRDFASYDGSRLTFGWQATTEVSPALQLVYGADTMREKARYDTLGGGTADTTISGAFGQALWSATPDVDVSATVRVDSHSSFGTFDTGRLAVAWRPTDATTFRFAAATGFRAPSIDELFGDYPDQQFIGFAGLSPETSQSLELGVEHAFAGGATLSATAFRLNIDNRISYVACPANDPAAFDFSCQPGTISTLENVAGKSVLQGLELTAEVPVTDTVRFGLAYTYTDARRPAGNRFGLVPFHDLTASLNARITPDLSAGLAVKHVAGRLDDFGSFGMPDYTTVKVNLDYDLGQGKSAYVRVENLFDKSYQTSNGYAASRRAVYAGLRASF
ncbi:TonB-dependent siderophore receptor [Pseudotabrizicola sp.]|uniref:TonB-dependent receptor plug domain-containing protein n=1 Tax=Pseudotabrizicola sp. TaxID=2939647 RepID=UPI00271805C2|nr:TonB-dependent receptor [Pseudotabrizicola sp.]MDO8884705.1 TonB-dependent receptor [Pseudotabrizicola sp.]